MKFQVAKTGINFRISYHLPPCLGPIFRGVEETKTNVITVRRTTA